MWQTEVKPGEERYGFLLSLASSDFEDNPGTLFLRTLCACSAFPGFSTVCHGALRSSARDGLV